jgi:hypothetical protein
MGRIAAPRHNYADQLTGVQQEQQEVTYLEQKSAFSLHRNGEIVRFNLTEQNRTRQMVVVQIISEEFIMIGGDD